MKVVLAALGGHFPRNDQRGGCGSDEETLMSSDELRFTAKTEPFYVNKETLVMLVLEDLLFI